MLQMPALMKRTIASFLQRNLSGLIDWAGYERGYGSKKSILKRIMSVYKAWDMPEGDYLEFGVHKGRSFVYAYHMAVAAGMDNMRFYAFDSFEGLPGDFADEESKGKHFSEGQFSFSEPNFLENLKKGRVDLDKVTTVKGFYDKVLTQELKASLPIKRAAVVWVDCDLYSSTVPVLDFVTDYLGNGTFLCFDDWFAFGANPYAGEIRAVDEWLERNKNIRLVEYRKFRATGIVFLVQRLED
jgi:O-methyltransferase